MHWHQLLMMSYGDSESENPTPQPLSPTISLKPFSTSVAQRMRSYSQLAIAIFLDVQGYTYRKIPVLHIIIIISTFHNIFVLFLHYYACLLLGSLTQTALAVLAVLTGHCAFCPGYDGQKSLIDLHIYMLNFGAWKSKMMLAWSSTPIANTPACKC